MLSARIVDLTHYSDNYILRYLPTDIDIGDSREVDGNSTLPPFLRERPVTIVGKVDDLENEVSGNNI